MNVLIKLEEALMFLVCLFIFPHLQLSWWWFGACLLLPDFSMVGYLVNNKTGAYSYNLFHHKGVAVVVGLCGFFMDSVWLEFVGLILFAHASMDRMLGYGLKYTTGFRFTHLGEIGHKRDMEGLKH